MDRLTKDPMDIEGIKLKDIDKRFEGNEFGYDKVVKKVMTMFDESISTIKGDLKKLGLIDNDQIMLNIEFVEGKTNRVNYNTNFIVIHNLLEIETNERGSRKTHPIQYNQQDLNNMVDKLNNIFGKYGFECCSQFPSVMKETPDFNKVLKSKLEIKGLGEYTIEEWLKKYGEIELKKSQSVKLNDGRRQSITSLTLMNDLRHKKDINELVEGKYVDQLVVGFLILYINSELGFQVLECFENEKLGRMSNQEGIVIYDEGLNGMSGSVKITGKFIYKD